MMEIIAQAVRVIDYENNSVQRRNVNMMPKFKDYIEQLIVHVSNNVPSGKYHTQSTRTEVIAGILEIAGNLETPGSIEEKDRLQFAEKTCQKWTGSSGSDWAYEHQCTEGKFDFCIVWG